MKLCIFEDDEYFKFEPLVFCRPVFDLKVGAFTLREKIANELGFDSYSLLCRDYLKDSLINQNSNILVNNFIEDDYLFINGRVFPNQELKNLLNNLPQKNVSIKNGDTFVSALISKDLIKKFFIEKSPEFNKDFFLSLPSQEIKNEHFSYAWDLIYKAEKFIEEDFNQLKDNYREFQPDNQKQNFFVINPDDILISDSAKIGVGVVIDASNGAVIIDDNASIMHNAVIYGPAYIGRNSLVKSNSSIYGGTSVGNFCKVAGEISNSILMDYSNKQHDGFLGHSFLGSWVNLGAGSITSNLKNNYSKIQVHLAFGSVKTDLQFLGLLAGDHSKSAIGTRFNTSTIVGFSCNIFGSDFTEKFIPSFAWGSIDSKDVYELDKAVKVAKIVYARRNKEFTQTDYNLFLRIFQDTDLIRKNYGYK